MFVLSHVYVCIKLIPAEMLATTTEGQIPVIPHLVNKDGTQDHSTLLLLMAQGFYILS